MTIRGVSLAATCDLELIIQRASCLFDASRYEGQEACGDKHGRAGGEGALVATHIEQEAANGRT